MNYLPSTSFQVSTSPHLPTTSPHSRPDPRYVSSRAKKRGLPQMGTLGAGNHYAEVQVRGGGHAGTVGQGMAAIAHIREGRHWVRHTERQGLHQLVPPPFLTLNPSPPPTAPLGCGRGVRRRGCPAHGHRHAGPGGGDDPQRQQGAGASGEARRGAGGLTVITCCRLGMVDLRQSWNGAPAWGLGHWEMGQGAGAPDEVQLDGVL